MEKCTQLRSRVTHNACTSVIVGPQATADGSVIIARTEDNHCVDAPKYMTVIPARTYNQELFISANNGFSIILDGPACGYTATPEGDSSEGLYEESGINTCGVAMSATESTYANDRVLALDPLVEQGIAEDAMVTVVLPFISSARGGVKRLGQIISSQGSAESNGVMFADTHEAWYMELVTGHHWVARRFSRDECAVCANRIAIDEVDFVSEDVLYSEGLPSFIERHHLDTTSAEASEEQNLCHVRRTFSTYSQQDIHYNAPRVWYAQRYLSTPTPAFSPLQEGENPQDLDAPFIVQLGRKVTLDDIDFILSSHYDGTEFDPLSTGGDAFLRKRYRPISLARTQEGHILQMRPYVRPELSGIHWVAFGATAFSPFIPVFARVRDVPDVFKTCKKSDLYESAYWIFRMLGVLAEASYPSSAHMMDSFLSSCRAKSYAFVSHMDEACKNLSESECLEVLTKENTAFLMEMISDTHAQIAHLLIACAENSKLTFKLDENL